MANEGGLKHLKKHDGGGGGGEGGMDLSFLQTFSPGGNTDFLTSAIEKAKQAKARAHKAESKPKDHCVC